MSDSELLSALANVLGCAPNAESVLDAAKQQRYFFKQVNLSLDEFTKAIDPINGNLNKMKKLVAEHKEFIMVFGLDK